MRYLINEEGKGKEKIYAVYDKDEIRVIARYSQKQDAVDLIERWKAAVDEASKN